MSVANRLHGKIIGTNKCQIRTHQNLENEKCSNFIPEKALKKQLTDKERIHREEQSIKIDEKDFDLIPVSVCIT